MVNVSWHDAVAFCEWLTKETGRSFRLPSEAEWEKAARGEDGRLYPWGNEEPDATRCNFNPNVKDTTPVGQYSPAGDSPYGCVDISGNVWEWTSSLHRPYPYQADDGREDAGSDKTRVVRGGSFSDGRRHVRCACRGRSRPGYRCGCFGFRSSSSRPSRSASDSAESLSIPRTWRT